jgi:alpha-beta hydrolase superfamily lysophospholipase
MRGATDDQARALLAFADQHPELVRGGSTWGWVLAASRSMHQLAQLPLQQVRTAVTVVRCLDDQTVSLPAQARVAARLRRARVVELVGGHDPFVGRADVRAALWDEVELVVQQAGRDS